MGRVDPRVAWVGSGRVGSGRLFDAVGPRGSYNLRIIIVNSTCAYIVTYVYRHVSIKMSFSITYTHSPCVLAVLCRCAAHNTAAARRAVQLHSTDEIEAQCYCTAVWNIHRMQ